MKEFKKYFQLAAEPHDVYNALTNKVMIEIWTGEDAEMEEVPGSEFSMWDGSICGKNIEFVKDHKIVQEWYFGEDENSLVTRITSYNVCYTKLLRGVDWDTIPT